MHSQRGADEGRGAASAALRLHWRGVLFGVVLLAYALLIWGVVVRSPLTTLDQDVLRLDLHERNPDWFHPLHTYVLLGQRAPSTLVALPWFGWRAWKSRSWRPLLTLGVALLMLNLSVGIVKLATGRRGPSVTHHAYSVFTGGDIFPSGHVSNAVVLYGVIAMFAVSYRRTVSALAVFLAVTVGLSTIYLDTHWLTDVVGGWIAGSLVLLALPTVMPWVERVLPIVWARLNRERRSMRSRPEPDVASVPADARSWPVSSEVAERPTSTAATRP